MFGRNYRKQKEINSGLRAQILELREQMAAVVVNAAKLAGPAITDRLQQLRMEHTVTVENAAQARTLIAELTVYANAEDNRALELAGVIRTAEEMEVHAAPIKNVDVPTSVAKALAATVPASEDEPVNTTDAPAGEEADEEEDVE